MLDMASGLEPPAQHLDMASGLEPPGEHWQSLWGCQLAARL